MALKIKASARSAAPSVPACSVPVPDAVPDLPVAGSVPVPGYAPFSGSVSVPGYAPSSGSVSVLVRVRYRDYIVQVSVPGDAHPRYISRCYKGRYTLTHNPLYARTWSNPDLAWHHALTLKEKLVDDPSSIR